MAIFKVPSYSESSQATNPHTSSRDESWLAKNTVHPAGEGAGGLSSQRQISYIIPEENVVVSEVFAQDRLEERGRIQELLQEHFGFEKLELCWNPRVRLLFKHTEGNSAISISPEAARQEISAEPVGILRRPDEPLVVKLLGTLQSRSEVKCTLAVKSIRCDFYYTPNSDDVILFNTGSYTIKVESSSGITEQVDPLQTTTLCPASWKLSNRNDTINLQLLACRYFLKVEDKPSTATRRPADDDLSQQTVKKAKAKAPAGPSTDTDTTKSKATSCLETPTTVWAGIDLQENQLVKVIDTVKSDVEYSVQRSTNWAHKNNCSEAFKAILDDGNSSPEAVVIKIIAKRFMNNSRGHQVIMQAADSWQREYQIHRSLQHPYIAALRGWDARTLSLFVEYKQSKDLASDFWRAKDGYFRGESDDAYRILAQMSNALKYLEERGIAHNDIKPGNILYTRIDWQATGPFPTTAAGAVLIDFGLATAADYFSGSGTPWYIPPEVLSKKRGPRADIFSLGVVMLYVLRRIPLPETWRKYPGWRLQRDYSKATSAGQAMDSWKGEVLRQAEALQQSTSIFVRESKLHNLVGRMLSHDLKGRITASELAEETKSWDTVQG